MKGILYGVGVGPGDPELLTLKAVKYIEACDIIALPQADKEKCTAYNIAKQAVPSIKEKEVLCLLMPMTKDKEILRTNHDNAARLVAECLDSGKNIAFLTLGDPTIYSTYIYVHKRIQKMGYQTEIISGIPSFCAVSARLNMGLVEAHEQLHILPASYQIEEGAQLPGTKVLMKAGKAVHKVKEILSESQDDFYLVENCGMTGERICRNVNEIAEDTGYYTIMILKDKLKHRK